MKIGLTFFSTQVPRIALAGFLSLAVLALFVDSGYSQDNEAEEEFTQGSDSDNDPLELFNRGQDFHSKGDLRKALDFYDRALKEKPDFPEAEYQRGMVYLVFKQHPSAQESFERVIILKKDWPLPYIQLGLLAIENGNNTAAESYLNEAIRLDDKNYIAYAALSDLLIKTKASDSRLRSILNKLNDLTLGRSVPIALWTSKAVIERKLGDLPEAAKSVASALAIDSGDRLALAELVEIQLAAGKYGLAIDAAKSFLKHHPESTNAKILLARAYQDSDNTAEALNVLEAIENPDKETISYLNALKTKGNLSIEQLETMLEADPNNVSALGRLCSAMRAEYPSKALDYCKRALTIDKNNVNYAVGYGAALVQLKQYPTAVEVLRNLLNYSPEDYSIHANLATALFQMERYEEAKKEYLWIVQQRPKLAIGYYFLAISRDNVLEYPEALESYRLFLKLADPVANRIEIEKVNLRVPILERQIKRGEGKKKKQKND